MQSCGSCHTLEAAGTQGAIGPNLDELQADEAEVLKAIAGRRHRQRHDARGLYEGADAEAVATFVADNGG